MLSISFDTKVGWGIIMSRDEGWLVKESIKALIVGGMAYYTYQEGLWGDAFHSSCFLGKFVERCPPEEEDPAELNEFLDVRNVALDDPEPCYPFIPHSGYLLYKLGYVWNQVVIYAFWFVLDAPLEMLEALIDLFRTKPKPKEIPLCPK